MIRLREEEFSDIVNYMRKAYGINLLFIQVDTVCLTHVIHNIRELHA